MRKIFILLTCIFVVMGLSACSSDPSSHSFDIQISPSKDLEKRYGYYPSFEVDVAALSSEDAIKLSTYSLEKYFEPSSGIRSYFNPVTFHFSERDLSVKTIKGGSDEFNRLMGREPTHFVIIANLPFADTGSDKDSVGLDPRKYIYKLPEGFFSVAKDLYFKVGATGLIRTTAIDAKNSLPAAPENEKQPIKMDLRCTTEKGKKDMQCQEKKENFDPSKASKGN